MAATARCNFLGDDNSVREGVCTAGGVCQSAEGGRTAFDDLESFIRNLSVSDALGWALSTDHYIPNYAWLMIAFALLASIIALLCKLSDKNDKKNKRTIHA
jgi:hypothetical protein